MTPLEYEVKRLWPQAELYLKPEWGSAYPDHRHLIRAAMMAQLGDPALADLSAPPRHRDYSLSISHCPSLGGFLKAPKPLQVGFDLEERSRLKESVVQRVSLPQELKLVSQNWPLLWTAKEAGFKALGAQASTTLSGIVVSDWRTENSSHHFRLSLQGCSQPLEGAGICLEDGRWLSGVFVYSALNY